MICALLNGCFYVLRGGIAWRMMPHDLPPWRVVYDHFSDWRRTGKWERINAVLRERYRVSKGHNPQPSAAVIDSQSVKTTPVGGPRGYDGGKKVKGRKRQILADTEGGLLLLTCLHLLFPRIVLVWSDTHYQWLEGMGQMSTRLVH